MSSSDNVRPNASQDNKYFADLVKEKTKFYSLILVTSGGIFLSLVFGSDEAIFQRILSHDTMITAKLIPFLPLMMMLLSLAAIYFNIGQLGDVGMQRAATAFYILFLVVLVLFIVFIIIVITRPIIPVSISRPLFLVLLFVFPLLPIVFFLQDLRRFFQNWKHR